MGANGDEAAALARQAEKGIDEGRFAEALALADRAAALDPKGAAPLAARARALRGLGRSREALAALEALARRRPGDALAHDARAVLLAEAGRGEEARAAFLAALACDPGLARAHFGLATLGRVAPAHRRALEALAQHPHALDEAGRLFLLYALAKAYDEAGDVARAFAAAEAGAAMRRARWRGDARAERARLTPAAPPPGRGDPTDRLVFVFGLPRSGTTLVEQILASHPDVAALGETERFADLVERGGRADEIASAYLAALPPAARVIDKSLGSARHIGAIRAVFPNARLVHVRRDPLDIGLSCHFTLFQHDLPFPPDLEHFGRYARAHGRLMGHWGAALPAYIWREIRYEALVAAPEREARALFDFIGLDMPRRALDLAHTRREVRTASLVQVREAPHRRSVGRWRAYAAHLAPLRRGLGLDAAPC